MITVLVFWISCHYNKDVDLVYAAIADFWMMVGIFKLLGVEL